MKHAIAGLTLVSALLSVGCGDDDRDAFNDVVLAPTATTTVTTTTSTTRTNTGTSTTGTTTSTSAQTVNAYVQLGGASNGSGSSASPYNSLAAAVAGSPENAIIFVRPAPNNAAVTENVTLKNGQQLIGQGSPSDTGARKVIADNTFPRLTGTITLRNNNTVSGFELVNSPAAAITGNGINSANINNVKITNPVGVAVNLLRVSGTVSFTDSDVESTAAVAGSALDLVNIRTDEFSDEQDNPTDETQGSAAGAAADTVISVTGNTLVGNGFTTNGVLVGNDELSSSEFRPFTRIRSIIVNGNTVRGCANQALWASVNAEPAAITLNGNTVARSRYGIWVENFGASSGTATVTGNSLSTTDYAVDVNLDNNQAIIISTNTVAVNAAFTAANSAAAAAPTATPTNSGVGIHVLYAVGSQASILGNSVAGGGQVTLDNTNQQVETANGAIFVNPGRYGTASTTASYTRIEDNTFTSYNTANPNQLYVRLNGAGDVAVRDNTGLNTAFVLSYGAVDQITTKLSILGNDLFNYNFNLRDTVTTQAEQAGTNGSTLLTAAGNTAHDTNTATKVFVQGNTLFGIGAGESNIPNN